MSSTTLKNAEARIQLLCSLGLDGEAVLPTLLKELRAVIPFNSGFFARGESKVEGIYAEHPDICLAIPAYESIWYAEEIKVMADISAVMKTRGPRFLEQKLKVSQKQYYSSTIYNELLIKADVHHMQSGTLRIAGRSAGVMALYRGKKEKKFTTDELNVWRRLEGFMAHALSHKATAMEIDLTEGDSALIMVDTRGKVQFMSFSAIQIFALSNLNQSHLAIILDKLRSRLIAIRNGVYQTAPPIEYYHSLGSRCDFRAYWLDPTNVGDSMIGISIQHFQPRALKYFSALSKFNLPKREAEICLHFLLGKTQEEIARQLNLSLHTVIHYRRQIYNRLTLSSRDELQRKILDGL